MNLLGGFSVTYPLIISQPDLNTCLLVMNLAMGEKIRSGVMEADALRSQSNIDLVKYGVNWKFCPN